MGDSFDRSSPEEARRHARERLARRQGAGTAGRAELAGSRSRAGGARERGGYYDDHVRYEDAPPSRRVHRADAPDFAGAAARAGSAAFQGAVCAARWAADKLPVPMPLALGVAAVFVALVVGMWSCVGAGTQSASVPVNGGHGASSTLDEAGSQEASVEEPSEPEKPVVDEAALAASLGANSEAEVAKLVKLSEDDPAALDFVAGLPGRYPQEAGEPISEAPEAGEIPLLLQWDQRWGYTVYSSSAFGLTACGPTCMAMVYQGLTGKSDLTPYDMGQIAQRDGYMFEYEGTDLGFFTDEPPQWGIAGWRLTVSEEALVQALQAGQVVICNVGPGDFTTDGHFIVITGLDENGDLVVNDPYSTVRSEKHWDVSQVIGQTRALFAYALA